jgi:hypothetical protein
MKCCECEACTPEFYEYYVGECALGCKQIEFKSGEMGCRHHRETIENAWANEQLIEIAKNLTRTNND